MSAQPLRRSERTHTAKSLAEAPSETPPRAQSSRKPKDADYDYSPPPVEAEPTSGPYASPKRNVQYKEDVSTEAKQAVVEDSVNGFCCAICGFSNHDGLTHNFCHILERSLSGQQETIKHLECKWGLAPKAFFIHSRSNMVILCPNCHTALDKRIVGLLPRTETIGIVKKWSAVKEKKIPVSKLFKHDPDDPLQYRLIDLGWKGKSPLVVHVRDENDEVDIVGVHPPFDHPLLQNIELHINPVYMIWNLGMKLQGLDLGMLDVPDWVQADLLKVRMLFDSWEPRDEDQATSGPATTKVAAPTEAVQSETSTDGPRRSKRLRTASNARASTVDVPPPSTKRSKKGKTAVKSSRR